MSSASPAQFVGSIPEHYDRCLGPIIFQDYANDLAQRAGGVRAANVLEIAAGTGISTVALRAALPASSRLVVTDLNPPMLEIARSKLATAANVEFQQADAMALPFGDGAFDLVVIQFGVMFFPDKPKAFAEIARVLRPGGTLLFNVWSTMKANPFAEIANAAAVRFFPENPPKFYLTPFGYADVGRVRCDLAAGGFADVADEVVRFDKEVPDWAHFAGGTVHGNPMIADIEASGTVAAADVAKSIADALQRRFGPAPARMPLEAIVFTAMKR